VNLRFLFSAGTRRKAQKQTRSGLKNRRFADFSKGLGDGKSPTEA